MAITTYQTIGLSTGATTARTASVTFHASTAIGDLLYIVCAMSDNSNSVVSATGWTVTHNSGSVGTGRLMILSKTRQAGDASYTLNITGADGVRWAAISVHGWDSAVTPVVGTLGTRASSGGTTVTNLPSVTTTGDNWTVLACAYERTNADDQTPTINNGMTILAEAHTVGGDSAQSVLVAQKIQSTAGATGITTITYTNTQTVNAAGIHIAIAPADNAPPVGRVNYLEDTFTRTVAANNWGTPDIGPSWVVTGTIANASVNGTKGLMAPGANQAARAVATVSPAQVTQQIEGEFTFDKLPVGGNSAIRFLGRYIDSSNDYQARLIITPTGSTNIQIARADVTFIGGAVDLGTFAENTLYKFKMLVEGSAPTGIKVKVWNASLAEPAWQINTTDNTAGYQVAASIGIRPNATSAVTNGPITFAFDNIIVSNGVEPIKTGQIGLQTSLSPASDSLTIGFDKVSGTTAKVALLDVGGTEITRTTATNDVSIGWGNVVFSGLTPATTYQIRFYIDDELQTDAGMQLKTLPVGTVSYVAIGGSCQFTASNHPVFDVMRADNPVFVAHMGDLHYADATTEPAWRAAMESSLTTPRMKALLQSTSLHWSMDNHDRIIMNPGGAGTALNYGTTNPLTASEWKYLAGSTGWASSDTLGRSWVAGRVRYIQADMWNVRQDPDFDTGTLTFLGATQKAWWKSTLEAATEPVIVWFCNWTMMNYTNGRWNSFPAETTELENWLNARPHIKRRMVMIGGDSHSLQADSGVRVGTSYRFHGIPSLNMSGFNRSGDAGDSGTYDIANAPLRQTGELESIWGGYSRITIQDNGTEVRLKWEAVRVNNSGVSDVMAYFERSYGQPFDNVKSGSTQADAIYIGSTKAWTKDVKGNNL